jgi:predicted nucleotidyltransferase
MSDRAAKIFEPPSAGDPLVEEIVRRLVKLYRPERVYLFGSAARGDAGPHSDYDFMVVVADGMPKEQRETKEVYKILRGIRAAVDVLVWTRDDFDKRLHLKASFPSAIAREGKLLYGAGPDTTG